MTYKITLGDKEFPSLKALCATYNEKYEVLMQKLAAGFSLEEAFDLKPIQKRNDDPHYMSRYQPITQRTILSDKYDIDLDYDELVVDANAYINSVTSVENINMTVSDDDLSIVFSIDGNHYTFPSLNAACREFNIASSTVRGRIKRGMSLVEALTNLTDIDNKGKIKKAVSQKTSLTPQNQPISITFDGKVLNFESQNEACRHFKVAASTFRTRRKKGKSIEEALGLF